MGIKKRNASVFILFALAFLTLVNYDVYAFDLHYETKCGMFDCWTIINIANFTMQDKTTFASVTKDDIRIKYGDLKFNQVSIFNSTAINVSGKVKWGGSWGIDKINLDPTWNSSYTYKSNVSKTRDQINETIDVRLSDISGFARSQTLNNCADAVVVNSAEDAVLNYQTVNCSANDIELLWLSPSGTNNVSFIYWGNSAETIFRNRTMRIWNDSFDVNSISNYYRGTDSASSQPTTSFNSGGWISMTSVSTPAFNAIFGILTNTSYDKTVYAWINATETSNNQKMVMSSCQYVTNRCWTAGLDRNTNQHLQINDVNVGGTGSGQWGFGGTIWHQVKVQEYGDNIQMKVWNISVDEQSTWNLSLAMSAKTASLNISGVAITSPSGSVGTIQFDNLEIWLANYTPTYYGTSSVITLGQNISVAPAPPPTPPFRSNQSYTYFCDNENSVQNFTSGGTNNYTSFYCNFGCNNDNPINCEVDRLPQCDLCNTYSTFQMNWIIVGIMFLTWFCLAVFFIVIRKLPRLIYIFLIFFIIILLIWIIFQTPTIQFPQSLDNFQITVLQTFLTITILLIIFTSVFLAVQ